MTTTPRTIESIREFNYKTSKWITFDLQSKQISSQDSYCEELVNEFMLLLASRLKINRLHPIENTLPQEWVNNRKTRVIVYDHEVEGGINISSRILRPTWITINFGITERRTLTKNDLIRIVFSHDIIT